MNPFKLTVLFAVIFLFGSGALYSAFARAGDLDLSFNRKGYSVEAFTGGGSARASTIQPDGKIVITGKGDHGSTYGFMTVRFNVDGSPDSSFGKNGKVLTTFGGITSNGGAGVVDAYASAIAVQPDGKIVIVGTISVRPQAYGGTNSEIAIVRYNPNGTLDNTFDGDGKLRLTAYLSLNHTMEAIAITADGKIVIAGRTGAWVMMLMRFNADGSFDAGFDEDGRLVYPAARTAKAIVIQSDGKMVVAGTRSAGNDSHFETVRFKPNGSIDTTFNGTGVAPVQEVPGLHSASALLLQPDGKIVVEGAWGPDYVALMRYNPDGTFDNSFGDFGFAYFAASNHLTRMALQPDQKIIVATTFYANGGIDGDSNFDVYRLNPDGSGDNSFNGTGRVSTPVGSQNDNVTGVVVQPDGKVALTGFTSGGFDGEAYVAVRYVSNGSLDSSYGSGGMARSKVGYGYGNLRDIAVQDDGKIVAAGDRGLARYDVNGGIDTLFNSTGTIDLGWTANALAIQPDAKILVAGGINKGTEGAAIARYNPDGTKDTGFGNDGLVITQASATLNDALTGLAVQPDGKIIGVGYASGSFSGDVILIRFNADGSPDLSFGKNGKVVSHSCSAATAEATGVALQADGKIVVSGICDAPIVFRFDPNGSLDFTFGVRGAALIPGMQHSGATDVKLQPDGRIVLAASRSTPFSQEAVVARFLTDGTLDPSFAGTGVFVHPDTKIANSLAIQNDGKIVMVGSGYNGLYSEFRVLRLNIDGTLDTASWGTNGVAKLAFEGDGYPAAAVLDAAGRVLVGGKAGGLFGIARFKADVDVISFVSVTGRVTGSNGVPISRATVSMTDGNAARRTAQTNDFGYYRFDDVRTGAEHSFDVSAKRFAFSPRTVTIGGELTDLDFVPNN